MSKLIKRAKTTIEEIDVPDVSDLRERVLDAVEQAMDRVEDIVSDAPAAGRNLRKSAAVNAASSFVVASIPAAMSALRSRTTRKNASRVARMTPVVVRSHPVLLGTTLLGTAAIGWGLARRRARLLREELQAERAASLSAVERMDGEGPMPGIDLHESVRADSRSNGVSTHSRA